MRDAQDEAQDIAKLFVEFYEGDEDVGKADDKAAFVDLVVQLSVLI